MSTSLYLVPPPRAAVEQPVTVEIRLAVSTDVNVVEGTIALGDYSSLGQIELSVADSAFSLWPQSPVYHPGEGKITFIGGAPAGVRAGSDVLVAKITFVPETIGERQLEIGAARVYRMDGAGTPEALARSQTSLVVAEAAGSYGGVRSLDLSQPKLTAEIGDDPSIYDGQPFVSFYAIDQGTGVAKTELALGMGKFVPVTSPYVLGAAERSAFLSLRTTDLAGNTQTVVLRGPEAPPVPLAPLLLLVAILILVVWRVAKKI